MSKFSLKAIANKKNLSFWAGAAGGYYIGKELTESGKIPVVDATYQPIVEGLGKAALGLVVYGTQKTEMIRGAGFGLAVNGGVQTIDFIVDQLNTNGTTTSGQQATLFGQRRKSVGNQQATLFGQKDSGIVFMNGSNPDPSLGSYDGEMIYS